MDKLKTVDYLMGIAVALTWGMGFVFAKAAIEHFPPLLLMAFRSTVTAITLVWFVPIPKSSIIPIFAVALISGTLQFGLTLNGLIGLDVSVAALVIQLEIPILVLLGIIVLREKPQIREWVGIVLAFVGLVFIFGEPRIWNAWSSILLVVGGCFAWALGQIIVRSLKDIGGFTVCAWVAVCAAPQLFISSALFESGQINAIISAPLVVWAAVLYLSLVMTTFGYGVWYSLVRRHPVSRVAPFLLLLPIFSIMGGVMFLGEYLTTLTAIGGLIIICGVAVITVEVKSLMKVDEPKSLSRK